MNTKNLSPKVSIGELSHLMKPATIIQSFLDCKYLILIIASLFLSITFIAPPVKAQTIVTTIPIGPEAGNGVRPTAIGINVESNLIYVANFASDNVSVIDGSTNSVIKSVSVGDFPIAVAVNLETNLIYVANEFSHNVSVIDGSTNKVINTVAMVAVPFAVSVNPSTNLIYVAGGGGISVIDGSTNQVINTVTVEVGLFGLAVNQETNLIYASGFPSSNVSVIDGSTNQVIKTVEVGGRMNRVI